MTKNIIIKEIEKNTFVYYKNNKKLKTAKGNVITVLGLDFAQNILNKIEKEENIKGSNFLKLFFFSSDLDVKQRCVIKKSIIKYLDTDLVCYRANKETELEKMQSKYWDPYIDFCKRKFELNFKKNYTVMPLIQEIANTDKVAKVLDNMDKYTLTAFFFLVEVTNSIIISLNILYKNVSYNLVWRDCNLEDEYNQLKWGTDEEFKKKLLYKKNFFIDIIDYIKIIKFRKNNGK